MEIKTIDDTILAFLAIAGGAILYISLLLSYIVFRIPGFGTSKTSGMDFFLDYLLDFQLSWITLFLALLGGALSIFAGVLILQKKKIIIPWDELMKETKLENIFINSYFMDR